MTEWNGKRIMRFFYPLTKKKQTIYACTEDDGGNRPLGLRLKKHQQGEREDHPSMYPDYGFAQNSKRGGRNQSNHTCRDTIQKSMNCGILYEPFHIFMSDHREGEGRSKNTQGDRNCSQWSTSK